MKNLLVLIFIFLLALGSAVEAAEWQTMTFNEDIATGLAELDHYCLTHDVTAADVLWANHTEKDSLASGTTIYLPKSQTDMLAIWQHVGAWKPQALVPVTSGAAARRLIAPSKQEQKQVQQVTAPTQATTPVPETPKPAQPAPPAPKTAPPVRIINNTNTTNSKPDPAKVIAQTAKPDKILTSKPRPKAEIPGLMDPIIILSPNGDPTNGPMRLVISGDKVEVVKLPQNAIPRKPSMSDLNMTMSFGRPEDYLPKYNTLAKPIQNNNIFTANLNGKMMWPVDGKISSPFGKWRGKHKHEGIDIPMPAGTPIRAAKNGVVIRTGNNSTIGFRGYGNFIMLDHGGNVRTFYAHCSKVAVVQGQKIMQGQIIGYVGSTGRSTANHLHFEVRINDTKVNPVPYLAGNTHLASTK